MSNMSLADGTAAAVGVRVVAVRDSGSSNYQVGHTGVISKLNTADPVVQWDHSGQQHQSSRGKLNMSNMSGGMEGKSESASMATALSLDYFSAAEKALCLSPQAPELAVNFICMHPEARLRSQRGEAAVPGSMKAAAARWQEIFLDLVCHHASIKASVSNYVLDERFDSFLAPSCHTFKRVVLRLLTGMHACAPVLLFGDV